MLFLAIFWSVIAGFLELLLLATGHIWMPIIMYIAVTFGVYYLGKAAAIEGDE